MSHSQQGKSKAKVPTTWGTDWYNYGIADHNVITLCPSS